MRRFVLLTGLVVAVMTAGCTQTLDSLSPVGGPSELVEEGNALIYNDMTVYVQQMNESAISGTVTSDQGSMQMVTGYRVERDNWTVMATETVPLDQYPPEAGYERTSAEGPFALTALITPDQAQQVIANGSVTVRGRTIRLSSERFQFNGWTAYNISVDESIATVSEQPPHLLLALESPSGMEITLQRVKKKSFGSEGDQSEPSNTDRNTSMPTSGTRIYMDTETDPSSVTGTLQDAELVAARKGQQHDVVAATRYREPPRVDRIGALLTDQQELGLYVPVRTDGLFYLEDTVYDIQIDESTITVNGTSYTAEELTATFDRLMATQQGAGPSSHIDVYAKLYDEDTIQQVGKPQVAMRQGYYYSLELTLGQETAEKVHEVIDRNYEPHSTYIIDESGDRVQMYVFAGQTEVTSVDIGFQFANGAITQPEINGNAPNEMLAQYRAGLIYDSIQIQLPADVRVTGTEQYGSGDAPTQTDVSISAMMPAEDSTHQPRYSSYRFNLSADGRGDVIVYETIGGESREEFRRRNYQPSFGERLYDFGRDDPWRVGNHSWSVVFHGDDGTVTWKNASFIVPGSNTTGSLTENEPVIGDEDAEVTMVYWTDYRCRYCERFITRAFQNLTANEVKDGDLRIVVKDLPIQQSSEPAAIASSCVWRQTGKDAVDTYERWHETALTTDPSNVADQDSIVDLAESVTGVDADTLDNCMDQRASEYRSEANTDTQQANDYNIQGAPSALIYADDPGQGVTVLGARSYSRFSGVIDDQMSQ